MLTHLAIVKTLLEQTVILYIKVYSKAYYDIVLLLIVSSIAFNSGLFDLIAFSIRIHFLLKRFD